MGLAAMNTSKEKSLLMMALVFAVVLYYLSLVLVTMLMLQQLPMTRSFLLIMVILLLGSVVSVLALMMILPTIAWIALAFWLFIFALVVSYYNRQKLYQLIPEKIKNLIEGHGGMSTHNSDIGVTDNNRKVV